MDELGMKELLPLADLPIPGDRFDWVLCFEFVVEEIVPDGCRIRLTHVLFRELSFVSECVVPADWLSEERSLGRLGRYEDGQLKTVPSTVCSIQSSSLSVCRAAVEHRVI